MPRKTLETPENPTTEDTELAKARIADAQENLDTLKNHLLTDI